MKILGLSFFYHDAAACLLVDGIPVAMSEEERFSRKKHDSEYPALAVEFVLREGGIAAKDLDWAVFYEKPFFKFERVIKTALATWPRGPKAFRESIRHLFLDKLWIRRLISKKLGIPPEKVLFSSHHLSHAASAFFCSPWDKAAILTVDGVGEWATASLAVGEGAKIRLLKEIRFPHSLGLLYSAFTAFLGFEVNEGEYKVMGMAPYGKPKYADKVRKLLDIHADGSFSLKMEYFAFDRSTERTYSRKFVELFGKPRDPKSKFFTRETGWPSYFGPKPEGAEWERQAAEQEYYADIAASVQEVLEEALFALANGLHRETGLDRLCMAGGVALNSVANWKLLEKTPFKELYVQPAAGDAGGALGAALAVEHIACGGPRKFTMKHGYYGASYSDEEIRKALEALGVKYRRFDDDEALVEEVARRLSEGQVGGWFQGRFEWGPRALGSRSIVADPRRAEMKDIVNTKIKFREPYRPFAPSVLAERAGEFFEIGDKVNQQPAAFMLYVVPVRPEKKAVIPAVTHVDGSARLQAVHKEDSPLYWKMIERFGAKTGVPVVMNTSFNLKGEPIVNTPADAFSTFSRSGMDFLAIGRQIVEKA